MSAQSRALEEGRARRLVDALDGRAIVLVGIMGCGKSSVGRRLAGALELPFVDADTEIELAANLTIKEIFAQHGEPYFRAGEQRVIARLLRNGAQVLATGGGAYMNGETRAAIAEAGIAVWLRAELDVIYERVRRRPTPEQAAEDAARLEDLMQDARLSALPTRASVRGALADMIAGVPPLVRGLPRVAACRQVTR